MVECSRVHAVEPSRAMVECSRVKKIQVQENCCLEDVPDLDLIC